MKSDSGSGWVGGGRGHRDRTNYDRGRFSFSWLVFTLCIWTILNKAAVVEAVCSLETGQNSVYWWIPEDRAAGSIIDSLPIEGNASGKSPEIELTLVHGTQWFTLDPSNKHLILKQAVDREFGDVKLEGVVECRSLLAGDHDFRVNITVNVKVQDVNDNAPLFDNAEYHFNVTEELPPGTVVFSGIRAVDGDQAGANSEVVYAIVDDGTPYSSLLYIPNPWEGTIAVNKRVDYEQSTNFSITIIAKDNGFPAMSSTAQIHVQVQDVDDQNPQFEHERYTANVGADTGLGAQLAVFPSPIRAYDGDTLNASLVYSMSGTDSDSFEIDSKTADIRLKKSLSSSKNYLLTVHARQTDRPERQAAAVVVVRVATTKSTKRKLQFSNPTFATHVSESTPINSQILRLTLAEEPESGSILVYSIQNSTNNNHFRMDQEKGTLWLVQALDYETRKEHRLRVNVTDGSQKSDCEVIVIVENANDNSPVFRHAFYTFSVNGTADEILGSIGTVTATDDDEGDRIAYSLLNLNDIFGINDLGQLRVRDAEKLANRSYELVVAATDSGNPPRVGHTIAKVEILDRARWHNAGGNSLIGRATVALGSSTFLLVTVLAAVLLALMVTVLLLTFYICRLRRRKRRTLLDNVNKRRQADGIIMANPVEAPPRSRASWSHNAIGLMPEPITPSLTDSTDASIFPIISAVQQNSHHLGSSHDVPLTVDTHHNTGAIEYSIPFIQSRHPGVVLRHPQPKTFVDEANCRDSVISLDRSQQSASLRPNSFTAAKPAPSLTVYF